MKNQGINYHFNGEESEELLEMTNKVEYEIV